MVKRILFYLAITAIGSLQLAYDIVSAPVMINIADDNVSAYIHDRYERRMASRMPEQTPDVLALNDVMIKATELCNDKKGVCDYLASVEK